MIPLVSISEISSLYYKTIAGLCSWADRFESYLVENSEERFSRDEAHMYMEDIRRHFYSGSNPNSLRINCLNEQI